MYTKDNILVKASKIFQLFPIYGINPFNGQRCVADILGGLGGGRGTKHKTCESLK
jgi:hypothetical protein